MLTACSSSGGRAPVSDITLQKQTTGTTFTTNSRESGKQYLVEKGDTLYGIAWSSGLDVDDLIKFNALEAPFIIHQGQTIRLALDKPTNTKKANSKSDLSSQNVNKNAKSDCTAQNCNKNKPQVVAQEKTKAYSDSKVDAKTIANNNETLNKNKVSDWVWPNQGELTKTFSSSQSTMQGISIVNKRGMDIYAAAAGTVVYAGSGLRGYGNLVIIKHNNDYLSAYAHNEALLVSENEQITVGQKIAIMGDTGTDHVHLHFEIRYQGKSVDPLRYLPRR